MGRTTRRLFGLCYSWNSAVLEEVLEPTEISTFFRAGKLTFGIEIEEEEPFASQKTFAGLPACREHSTTLESSRRLHLAFVSAATNNSGCNACAGSESQTEIQTVRGTVDRGGTQTGFELGGCDSLNRLTLRKILPELLSKISSWGYDGPDRFAADRYFLKTTRIIEPSTHSRRKPL